MQQSSLNDTPELPNEHQGQDGFT